jgi:hypothetical protein
MNQEGLNTEKDSDRILELFNGHVLDLAETELNILEADKKKVKEKIDETYQLVEIKRKEIDQGLLDKIPEDDLRVLILELQQKLASLADYQMQLFAYETVIKNKHNL